MTDSFAGWARGGLQRAGVPVSEADIEMLRLVDGVYGPALSALEQADLAAVDAEPDLDPGRAPRG